MSTKSKKIAAVYCRKSREDARADTVSIKEQEENGKALAVKLGYQVPEENIYADSNLSGKLPPKQWREGKRSKYRPEFTRLIEGIEAGKIDIVIVRKTDRIARNTLLSLRFYDLLKTHKVGLQATSETLPTDGTQDAGSTFALTVLSAAAQLQLQQIQENIQKSKDYAKKHGLAMTGGHRLLGYHKEGKEILIDEKEGHLVREMYRLYLDEGYSLSKLATWYDEHPYKRELKADFRSSKSVKLTSWQVIKDRLKNPAYIGMAYNSDKEIIPSKVHPAIIDIETWQRAQKRMESRKNTRSTSNNVSHLMSGLITCSKCGKHLTPYIFTDSKDTSKKTHYFKCRYCKGLPNIQETEYDLLALNAIAPLKIKRKTVESKDLLVSLKKVESIENNISDMEKAFSNGEVDFTTYNKISKTLKTSLEDAKKKVEVEQEKASSLKKATSIKWDKATIDEKREYIQDVCKKITLGKKGVLIELKDGVEIKVGDEIIADTYKKGLLYLPVIKRVAGVKTVTRKGTTFEQSYKVMSLAPKAILGHQEYFIDGEEYGIGEGKISVWGADYSLDKDITTTS